MDVYHGGLGQLIGQTYPDIMNCMAWEHIESPYSAVLFQNSTNNKSTAAQEYNYVVNFSGVVKNLEKGRNGYALNTLWEVGSESFKLLINRAGLQKAEVAALRLYTGTRVPLHT